MYFCRSEQDSRFLREQSAFRTFSRPKFKLLGKDNKQPLNPQLFFSSSSLSLSLMIVEDLDQSVVWKLKVFGSILGTSSQGARLRQPHRHAHLQVRHPHRRGQRRPRPTPPLPLREHHHHLTPKLSSRLVSSRGVFQFFQTLR